MDSGALKAGRVGLLGAATLGVVMLSPAMTLYGNFGPSFLAAGDSATLAFVLALLSTLPTALSYAMLSRDFPSAGSAANWMSACSGDKVGTWAGWMVFSYYFNNFIMQPITAGVFLGDLLTTLHLRAGFAAFALGALVCTLWPARIAYRGVSPSTHGALGFLLFETAVVVLLCATVLWVFGHRFGSTAFSTRGLTVAGSPRGMAGIFQALIFGLLAFCGFDVVSTLSEEGKMPRTMIPRATFLALGLFGVFVIGGVWTLTHAISPARLQQVTAAGGMPITEIAQRYWGRFSLLIPITAISASLGIAIATSIGASRILFSMSRSGLTHRRLAELSPVSGVPRNAMHCIFAGGLLAAVLTAAALGPYRTYVWWGTTSTFFAMVTYLMVNAAHLSLFRERARSSWRAFVLHSVAPLCGIAIDLFILVRAFAIELWRQGWAMGQSILLFDVGCALLFAVVALTRQTARPRSQGTD